MRMTLRTPRLTWALLFAAAVAVVAALVAATGLTAGAGAAPARRFTSHVFASGAGLSHPTGSGTEPVSKPDDITVLSGRIYVAFANGVGPQGQASTTGTRDSTIVEFTTTGRVVHQWDVLGKCDGLTADPAIGKIVATVNEDANSSVYLIAPAAGGVHYRYRRPVPSHGGTDAITVDHGQILISASAPGTSGRPAPQAAYPAAYRATFDARTHVATLHGLFSDEARARVANGGSAGVTRLALSDPDSSELVPAFAHRFGGDFMLTSQAERQQIFTPDPSRRGALTVITLSASVDDTAWPSSAGGALYASDPTNNRIDRITGPFQRGEEVAATTPCDQANAPSTCPGPGFATNYLGAVDTGTGRITPLLMGGTAVQPTGLLFLP